MHLKLTSWQNCRHSTWYIYTEKENDSVTKVQLVKVYYMRLSLLDSFKVSK